MTIARTAKVESGMPHRVHRSKKGRTRKKKFSSDRIGAKIKRMKLEKLIHLENEED